MRITRKITRKLTSIIALSVMVAALLAVVAVTQFGTANAQVAGRAINNLQLSHNDDGDLLISWDAPELAPRDYRVMWADSDENYKTWTDTTGNAFPTSASHTVSGLDRGHEYKVKVRARYSNGSGPWSAEATHTIPEEQTAPPTPAPSNAPHWVSSDMPNHVAMFDWSDVENAVGYEIQMHIGTQPDDWEDIADPSGSHGYRAYMHGSSAIIGALDNHERTVRVRGVFEDDTTTDWYAFTIRPE